MYNGKELQDELGLDLYDYYSRFYDPALGRFTTMDPLAEDYYNFSPYSYVANNPIIFVDPTGMAIDYSDLYEQDEDGNYLHEQQIRAFEAFAMTDIGRQYIIDRAQEGFELTGVFEKDLSISLNESGVFDKKGIDVSFSVETLDDPLASGEGGMDVQDGRLKLSVQLEPVINNGTKEQVFDIAETIGHEVFYHGDANEKNFLKLPASQRTQKNVWSQESHDHTLPFQSTKYHQVGIDYLQNVQSVLGYRKINTRNYLYYNVILPQIGYGEKLRPDIKY